MEVCPILEQGPTASGDYTQPVIAKNLQLHTRNLPQPVSLKSRGGGWEDLKKVDEMLFSLLTRYQDMTTLANLEGVNFQLHMSPMKVLYATLPKMM